MPYAVAYFNDGDEEPKYGVFPNIFETFDMAVDCVIFQIKDHHGDVVKELKPLSVTAGQHLYQWENTAYVIGKLFNYTESNHA